MGHGESASCRIREIELPIGTRGAGITFEIDFRHDEVFELCCEMKLVGDTIIELDRHCEICRRISADKIDTEIPSPVAGVLQKIVVAVDQTVPVGAELAVIASDGAAPVSTPAPVPDAPVKEAPVQVSIPEPVAPAPVVASAPVSNNNSSNNQDGTYVTMPALGESVTEGTVTRWLKSVGDFVNADEALLEVSTDKVDTEIPSPVSGVILSIEVQVDSTVPVGARLATIGGATQASAPVSTPAPVATPVATPVAPTPVRNVATPTPASALITDAYVTPIVRKLAADNGVDLSRVRGTGIGGRIRKEDVLAAVTSTPVSASSVSTSNVSTSTPAAAKPVVASPLRGTVVPMSRLRKVIAARMVESLQVSAQLTTVVEVDVTKIARLRDKAKGSFESREGTKLSFLPFFAVAVCEALKQHPVLNASIDGDNIVYHGAEHLGVAVDTERGLLVPVIKDAGDLNIGGVARRIADVAARTRDNKISPDELSGGTFTLTNTGSRGALFDTPIINQPQVAILGMGAVVKRPMVLKGADGGENIAIRSMVYLALSYDHRIVDGADAARFLVTLKDRLEEGRFESDLGL